MVSFELNFYLVQIIIYLFFSNECLLVVAEFLFCLIFRINYALYEELEAEDAERARDVYR